MALRIKHILKKNNEICQVNRLLLKSVSGKDIKKKQCPHCLEKIYYLDRDAPKLCTLCGKELFTEDTGQIRIRDRETGDTIAINSEDWLMHKTEWNLKYEEL